MKIYKMPTEIRAVVVKKRGVIHMLDIQQIKELIPHRYPFLLVDKVTEMEEGERVVGYKNVTINEPFFQGHFPDYPVMPGVLIHESLAQVGAIAVLGMEQNKEIGRASCRETG